MSVEWIRPPRPPAETRAERTARRLTAAGEAAALWMVGMLVGCGLAVAAAAIARSIG